MLVFKSLRIVRRVGTVLHDFALAAYPFLPLSRQQPASFVSEGTYFWARFRKTRPSSRIENAHMTQNGTMTRLHYEMIRGLIETGACPTNETLAEKLAISPAQIEAGLKDLAACHGIVLHPYATKPWVVHPFSLTPTLHWVEGDRAAWWAPCIWCALGVAAIVGGKVTIHTRIRAEREALAFTAQDGVPVEEQDLVVHFAIPPEKAWRNVHEHCSMVLAFRSTENVKSWCDRHGLPHGQLVPLSKVSDLARKWYGHYASPQWHKWAVPETRQIFQSVGLTSEFWSLGDRKGRF
jgi:hypothetical protein